LYVNGAIPYRRKSSSRGGSQRVFLPKAREIPPRDKLRILGIHGDDPRGTL